MEYRALGRTGITVGAIGLGTEHLERRREAMDAVLGMAVEAGVNYVDLLYTDGDYWAEFGPVYAAHRDKLVAAAHWNAPECWDVARCQRDFDNILRCLGNDYAEIGLITMVDSARDWADGAQAAIAALMSHKQAGRIGGIGMSSHNLEVCLTAIRSGLIDVLMFPINVIGENAAGQRQLIEACAAAQVGLVAMKVYNGGTLFGVGGKRSGVTPAQCLAYVLSLPISTTVPGPRNSAEWRDTLHYLETTPTERDFGTLMRDLQAEFAGQCVYCQHCLPCPEGIVIPWQIWLRDHAQDQGVTADLQAQYNGWPVKSSACTECGICLERCPFGVDIPARLREAAALFE